MRSFAPAAVALTLLSAFARPARAADDDLVFLVNGGRLRGTVVQEDPTQGVRIRLADGTIRNIAAKDVKSVQYAGETPAAEPTQVAPPLTPVPVTPVVVAPPLGVGSIHVETTAPATVIVDGGLVGKAPADVKAAAVGRHRVRVDFDDGGSREKVVLVQAGETSKVTLDQTEGQLAFVSHKGLHFGFAGELNVPLIFNHSGAGDTAANVGAGAAFLINYGISQGVDFRATAFADATGGNFPFLPIGVSAGFRFNLGSTYTMGLGLRGGVCVISGASGPVNNYGSAASGSGAAPFFGPELSLIGFRFGERRQYSIELAGRFGFYFFSGDSSGFSTAEDLSVESAISFSYLFLDPPPGAKSAPTTGSARADGQ